MASLQLPRQAHRDEDVLLAGEHQRRDRDLAEPVGRVVRLDHRELGEVGATSMSSAAIAASNSAASPGAPRRTGR